MKKIIVLALLILSTYNVLAEAMLTGKAIGVKDGDNAEVMDNQNKTTIFHLEEVNFSKKINLTTMLPNNSRPMRYIARRETT